MVEPLALSQELKLGTRAVRYCPVRLRPPAIIHRSTRRRMNRVLCIHNILERNWKMNYFSRNQMEHLPITSTRWWFKCTSKRSRGGGMSVLRSRTLISSLGWQRWLLGSSLCHCLIRPNLSTSKIHLRKNLIKSMGIQGIRRSLLVISLRSSLRGTK